MPDVAKDAPLAERLIAGDKRALARAITLIESDDPAGWELVREVYPRTGKARIIGFTGPPGVGKSTLIGALTGEMRKADREVAVLSIDPSSPFTRGALLGDRIRLSEHFLDPGVFIRSMASRGALGGLSEAALQVALVMDAAGKDDVLIETVGVGQAEIDIVDHADTIILALMPGSGDSIQALKAGVMEIPDIIVVNKADHPMTDTMVREVRGVLALSYEPGSWKVPILRTEAARGEGVEELAEKIDEHRAFIEAAGTLAERRARNLRSEVVGIATSRMRRALEAWAAEDPGTAELLEQVVRREARPGDRGRTAAGAARRCLSRSPAARLSDGSAIRSPTSRASRSARSQSVYIDSTSHEPAWLVAKLGGGRRRGGRVVAVPVDVCAGAPGAGVWAAIEGSELRGAPVVDPSRPLLREHELTICEHFGISGDVGRAGVVADLTEGAGDARSRRAAEPVASRFRKKALEGL